MKISILVDNPKSWALDHAKNLHDQLKNSHSVSLIHDQSDIESGDIAIFLSCGKLVKGDVLKKNKHNLVPHASALPQGKGWAPLTWQILEGKNDIPVTLFEAVEKVDAGLIYDQIIVSFEGHELIDEMQKILGKRINEMLINFINNYPKINSRQQNGEESFYERRRPENSELDPNKTIAEQFNMLRVVNNEKYPAFFKYREHTYFLKIYKDELPNK